MRLMDKIIARLDGERRANAMARELGGLDAGELRARGLGTRDILRLARLAVYHPLAELRALERPRAGEPVIGRLDLSRLLGQAMSLRAA
jgi:hypothetical protein